MQCIKNTVKCFCLLSQPLQSNEDTPNISTFVLLLWSLSASRLPRLNCVPFLIAEWNKPNVSPVIRKASPFLNMSAESVGGRAGMDQWALVSSDSVGFVPLTPQHLSVPDSLWVILSCMSQGGCYTKQTLEASAYSALPRS